MLVTYFIKIRGEVISIPDDTNSLVPKWDSKAGIFYLWRISTTLDDRLIFMAPISNIEYVRTVE